MFVLGHIDLTDAVLMLSRSLVPDRYSTTIGSFAGAVIVSKYEDRQPVLDNRPRRGREYCRRCCGGEVAGVTDIEGDGGDY